MDQDRFSAETN